MSIGMRVRNRKKKGKGSVFKYGATARGGLLAPLVGVRLQGRRVVDGGSEFVVVSLRRDDVEVAGALASIGGKTLDELKRKYKKFSISADV